MSAPNFLSYDATEGNAIEVAPGVTGGIGDAEKIPALDANGNLPQAMMPTGVGPELVVVPASEDLAAGDFVHFHDNAGATNAQKADATDNTKPAHGFVKDAVIAPANASVYVDGQNSNLSGLTKGDTYFLSAATSGAVVSTAPAASGNLVQRLGIATAVTSLVFKPQEIVVRA